MPYAPPLGNLIEFDFDGSAYVPYPGNLIEFNFDEGTGAEKSMSFIMASKSSLSYEKLVMEVLALDINMNSTATFNGTLLGVRTLDLENFNFLSQSSLAIQQLTGQAYIDVLCYSRARMRMNAKGGW